MRGIRLGDRVRHLVSGFGGIAVARCAYLSGCIQFGIKPPVDKDGKMIDVAYLDEGELEIVETGVVGSLDNESYEAGDENPSPVAAAPGGPTSYAPIA